ncbi:MAG: aminopeptidase P N-terminal domain-containing protein [Oscillospiraceae bacterium]
MDKNFFIRNRQKLINSMQDNSAALLFAGKDVVKSEDENYPFYVNNNFFYMTGLSEHDLILVITKRKGIAKQILFINDYSEKYQLWRGRQLTDIIAKEISGIDEVKYLSTFENFVFNLLTPTMVENVYLDLYRDVSDKVVYPSFELAEKIKSNYPHILIKNVYEPICQMRYIKEEEEIDEIKKAISITYEGIKRIFSDIEPNMFEYQLDAAFSYEVERRGVKEYSFPTIAATGKNACTMHYEYNDSLINDGELVLFDLGGKWNHYCSDISRTIPANGKFTDKQKEIYNIVLEANKRAIAAAKPDMTGKELDANVVRPYFVQELKKLGLIKEDSELRKYYPHSLSHPMGLDNHDVGYNIETNSYDLLVGSVQTIEPGLYIPEWKIGVRIEDDILITENGCINLTAEVMKEIDEIEAFMAK